MNGRWMGSGIKVFICCAAVASFVASTLGGSNDAIAEDGSSALAPLPAVETADPAVVELGKMLFFEPRISGDGSTSCATCHDPAKGWSDGMALSDGYPGTKYFRRSRSIVNTAHKQRLYWDGRMSGSDVPTLVRDHIAEAHFMQADGRLVLEQLRQIPYYESTFKEVMGGEPSYGRILNGITAFVKSVNSVDVPFDRFLEGDTSAISEEAQRGLDLFRGKAGCVQCHNGPMLTDNGFHDLGIPTNPDLFNEPLRHITFRRFYKTLGVAHYYQLDHDPGLYGLTKRAEDDGKFKTPSLREVSRTPPYMHNGTLATLEDVVKFYDTGGMGPGAAANEIRPLGLSSGEKSDLVAFLKTLSGAELIVEPPAPLYYEERELGKN